MVEVTEGDKLAARSILWVQTLVDDIEAIEQTFATHREAAAKAVTDRLRPHVFEAVRQAWFAGRGSNRGKEYDSETVEAAWNKLIDRALAAALEKQP